MGTAGVIPKSGVPRLGALARWRSEIERGERRNDAASFDDLAAAACWETWALELERAGDPREAQAAMDTGLLRLRGCYGSPHDGTPARPGPGRRLLHKLRARAGAA